MQRTLCAMRAKCATSAGACQMRLAEKARATNGVQVPQSFLFLQKEIVDTVKGQEQCALAEGRQSACLPKTNHYSENWYLILVRNTKSPIIIQKRLRGPPIAGVWQPYKPMRRIWVLQKGGRNVRYFSSQPMREGLTTMGTRGFVVNQWEKGSLPM